MKVTALLVSHDGARWLPAVIQGLESSTRLPDAFSLVDTGSTDESADLVASAFGGAPVRLDRDTSYAAAVAAGLEAAGPAADDEWVWLLHDDARPDPGCLAALVDVAERSGPEVVALGPKLREWPSLKRLLEVGVTISGAGRRETGLEPGEYDQGQHEDPQRVLAVNTAGMLVRREHLERFGFDPDLPLFGNDLDFGWRLARAGFTVLAVPDAVMFHAEGAHRARRRGELARRPHRDERVAAMHTLLANSSTPMFVVRWFRLLLGGALRAVGHLLIRRPGRARDEIAALGRIHLAPGRLRRARQRRTAETTGAPDGAEAAARSLLAPAWMPLRHALDFLGEVGRAIWGTVREAVHVRTGAGPEATVSGQLLRSPTTWVLVLVLGVSLVAGRTLMSGGPLHGGALLPAPDGVGHWWRTWAESWHWIGVGSSVSAPGYLLPLAVVGTALLGQAGAVTWLLFVLAGPLAFWGAVRFLRRLAPGRLAIYWGAAAYALVPVVSGALAQGRLGTVVAAVLLPWTAGAALRLGDPAPEKRVRAVWRTALGVSLIALFVPFVWLVALVLVASARWWYPTRVATLSLWPIVVAPLVASVPWLFDALRHPGVLLLEAGRSQGLSAEPSPWELLAGRLGGPGDAPWWFGLGIVAVGVVALLRSDTRAAVSRAWMVALVGALGLLVLSRIEVRLPGVDTALRPSYGLSLLLVQGALIVAATLAGNGAVRDVAGRSFTWRQPVAGLGVLAAVGAVVLGAGWWVAGGTPGPLDRGEVRVAPVYMGDLANSRPDGATLLLRGGPTDAGAAPVSYTVVRADAPRLGDEAVTALTPPDEQLTDVVQRILAGSDRAAEQLASYGIAYVHAPGPVSDEVAGAFDATEGFAGASADSPDSRAWRVTHTPDLSAIDDSGSPLHVPLLVVQVLALIALLVLAAPGRSDRREGDVA